ncbi:MAG TPA: hypothetical protein GXX33_05525 [Firmicutes bacterium]|nr:hypothetical protein [Bacillota bacterium]
MVRKAYGLILFILVVTGLLAVSAAPARGFTYDNPAEEAFTKTHFELLLPEMAVGAKNNLFTLSNINIDLTNPGTKADFLGQMSGGQFKADFTSQLKTGLTIGRFSAYLRPFATGSLRLASGLPELVLVGYGSHDNGTNKVYNLAGTKANSLAGVALDFKYGHPVKLADGSTLGIGVTFHYIKGLAMFDAEITSGTLTVDQIGDSTIRTKGQCYYVDLPVAENGADLGSFFTNTPGSGFLLDLGVAYERDRIHAGLVLKNIGALKWRTVNQASISYEGAVETGPEGTEFLGDDPVTEEKTISDYTMGLPLVLQIHGSYQLYKSLYWNVGMETGFADGWGISSVPCLQTGLEWRPGRWIRLAADISYHDRHFNYNTLLELQLFFLWTRFQLGWTHEMGGLNAAAMLALHF